MIDLGSPIGAKAVLYDIKSGETIAKATIADYDRQRHVITISAIHGDIPDASRVSMLILAGAKIFECVGNARKQMASGSREIALFRATEKESREAPRHTLRTPAQVVCLMDEDDIPLRTPIPVMVEDISTGGVLLQVDPEFTELDVGAHFRLRLRIAESNVLIDATAVREVPGAPGTLRLGCQLLALRNEE